MTLFHRLGLLRVRPFGSQAAEEVISQEVVKGLPLGRMVKPSSHGDDPLRRNLLRDDWPTEALLLLPSTLKRLDLLPLPLNTCPNFWRKLRAG